MKDSKTLLLLIVSLLLLLASITLLWSWGYQFRFAHTENTKPGAAEPAKDNTQAIAKLVSDSLQKTYYATLDHLDHTIDSVYNHTDSLKGNLDVKLAEFYQLRNQITELFKNKTSDADIKLASTKIQQLQQRITQLRISNTDVENENKRLNTLLVQYNNDQSNGTGTVASPAVPQPNKVFTTDVPATETRPVTPNRPVAATITLAAADLQLAAFTGDEGKEKETFKADDAEKLSGTFTVRNTSDQSNSTEVMIVVLQPDGRVMQKSTWESGSFQTNNGKKIYSCKMQADCAPGEIKRLRFWLGADKYQKGNYTMQVYHNGILIGRVSKILS